MTEKDLIKKAGDALDAKLEEAKKTGNLVVKDATEDEAVIRSTFEKGEGVSVCSLHSYREDSVKQVTD